MINQTSYQRVRNSMLQLRDCGFQPFDSFAAQGSGVAGRALSADGSTWAEIVTLQSGLRNSLRQLLKKTGALRGAGCTAQFTTEFNNHSYLVTTTADLAATSGMLLERLPAETPLATVAQRHMQRIEAHLRSHHPLKPVLHTCAEEVEAARRRAAASPAQTALAPQPYTVEALHQLGVPPRLALLIAGDFAETTASLPL